MGRASNRPLLLDAHAPRGYKVLHGERIAAYREIVRQIN
jgi:hypothetical protein